MAKIINKIFGGMKTRGDLLDIPDRNCYRQKNMYSRPGVFKTRAGCKKLNRTALGGAINLIYTFKRRPTGSIPIYGVGGSIYSAKDTLSYPTGVTYDSTTKKVYIVDSGHDRIIEAEFGSTSHGWRILGRNGSGTYRFDEPTAITKVGDSLFVSDDGILTRTNGRIIETEIDGTGWTAYGSYGSGTGQFDQLGAMAYDSTGGYWYICDRNNLRIIKTKLDGSWTGWTALTGMPAAVYWDSGIVYTGGYVYAPMGTQDKILKTNMAGDDQTYYGSGGTGTGEFDWPTGMVYDSVGGHFYICDYNNDRIVKTKLDGSWTDWATLGSNGTGAYQFDSPVAVDYDSTTGYLYVADYANHRVVECNMAGTHWREIKEGYFFW